MNERELDNAIDAAARTLMASEPSRELAYRVMAHVRESECAGSVPRSFMGIAAVATIALCAAIATAVTFQAPEPVVHLPPAVTLPIAKAAAMPPVPIRLLQETPQTNVVASGIPTKAISAMAFPGDISNIEPIGTEPIAMSAIDVPQLEREATSIEIIRIEPITIEPLSASND